MSTTTLSTKGQIIIPKEVRERHGWAPGLALEILEQGDSVVLRPVSSVPATTVDDLLGCLPHTGPARTLEEMEAGIAEGARRHATAAPARRRAVAPATRPTVAPATRPTVAPATRPTVAPATRPTGTPATRPTVAPATRPTVAPATRPAAAPGQRPAAPPAQKRR